MATSSLSSLNRSMLRLSGLSSGLDTDSIVKNLLKIDQLKVDKQFKLKTNLEWKSNALREVNTLLRNFRSNNMSALSQDNNMLSTSNYNLYKVTMGSETNAVKISASSQAAAGSVTINSITHIATAAKAYSTNISDSAIATSTTLKDAATAFSTDLTFEDGQISFSINGQTFTFGENDTIAAVINKVNSNSAAGVTMSYSSLKKGFTITAKTTGASSAVVIDNLKGNAFTSADKGAGAFGIAEGTVNGQDAELMIDGVNVKQSSNTFTIDGITYTLKDESTTAIDFTVERDIDSTFNKIVSFVDNYNSMIATLQGKLDEEVFKDFDPLTDEERDQLSDEQATKWEEKAKSGLLAGDDNIERLLGKMRSAFYSAVADTGLSPSNIGLNTGSYLDHGKITIDKDKLRAALENNPDQVTKIFTNVSKSTDPTTKFNESGLVTRISDIMASYVTNTVDVTLKENDEAIDNADDRLSQLQDLLSSNEEKYYAKFTAMETALAKLNSQTSLFSSLTSKS